MLTIESSYQEAGVHVTIDPDHSVVDDHAPQFDSWTPALLHDAMETYFSQYGGTWPNWQMWGLMAGLFETPGVGGVMFDAASQFGGPLGIVQQPPHRSREIVVIHQQTGLLMLHRFR